LSAISRKRRAFWIANTDWLAKVCISCTASAGNSPAAPFLEQKRAEDPLGADQRHHQHGAEPARTLGPAMQNSGLSARLASWIGTRRATALTHRTLGLGDSHVADLAHERLVVPDCLDLPEGALRPAVAIDGTGIRPVSPTERVRIVDNTARRSSVELTACPTSLSIFNSSTGAPARRCGRAVR